MKAMISGIKRMEIHDGDGLRTTVFFKGCPLRCIWCHNPESLSFEKQAAHFEQKCVGCGTCKNERSERTKALCPVDAIEIFGREYELSELVDTVMRDAPFFRNGGGVTLSGGECLAQPDFAIALAKALYDLGISVYIDTCGYVKREVLEQIIPYTDKFLYDIKAVDSSLHRCLTGRDNGLILENLKFLSDSGCKIEIRYPLVIGYNDSECESIAKALSGLRGITKVKVLQYHSFAASRYRALGMVCSLPDTRTTPCDMENAVSILSRYGLAAVNGITDD